MAELLEHVISDFSGGVNTIAAEKLADNEMAELSRCWHVEGSLISLEGRTSIGSAIVASKPINGLYRFYKTGQPVNNTAATTEKGWLVARCSTALWMYVPIAVNASNYGFQPIAGGRTEGTSPLNVMEDFESSNGKLYVTNGTDANLRWDGTFYQVGTASCAGGTTAVVGTGTTWLDGETKGSVKIGDVVFFKIGGLWSLTEYRVGHITDETHLELVANGPNTGGTVPYIIVRTHAVGLSTPSAPTAVASAGAGLSEGNYNYIIVAENSSTAWVSDRSVNSGNITCTGANHQGTVTIPTISDPQVNQVSIYRPIVNTTSPWFFVATVSRNATFGWDDYVDSTPDGSLGAQFTGNGYHTAPPILKHARQFNGRMYGWTTDNILRFSTIASPEYWPVLQYGTDDPSVAPISDATLGGYVEIGETGEQIMAVAPEGGAYALTGHSGSNLLVLTRSGGWRWYGLDWIDFQRTETTVEGCIGSRTLAITPNMLIWLSRRGPVGLTPGTQMVTPLYEKMYPAITHPFYRSFTGYGTDVNVYGDKACAVVWNDWYIFAKGRDGGSYGDANAELIMLHVPTRTFTTCTQHTYSASTDTTISSMCVYGGPGDYGELKLGHAQNGTVYSAFSPVAGVDTTWESGAGVHFEVRTGLLTFGNPFRDKKIHRIVTCWDQPATSQTISLETFTNGETTTATETAMSGTVSSTGVGRRSYVEFAPVNAQGRGIQLRITGTFTRQMTLLWIKIWYSLEAEHFGATVG